MCKESRRNHGRTKEKPRRRGVPHSEAPGYLSSDDPVSRGLVTMGLRCGLRKKFLEPRIVLGQGQPYRRNFMSPVLRKYSSSDELTPAHSPKANAICERV